MEQVESGLAEVCVLSSDVFSMILAMVSKSSDRVEEVLHDTTRS
jgi:hypothetical protein